MEDGSFGRNGNELTGIAKSLIQRKQLVNQRIELLHQCRILSSSYFYGGRVWKIKFQDILSKDYTEVVILWNDVLGVHTVTGENLRANMDQMIRAGNYKTFRALLKNQVVGSISIVYALAVGSANGYLHITGLAVHNDFQRHKVGTELLRYTENYAKDSRISSIIFYVPG